MADSARASRIATLAGTATPDMAGSTALGQAPAPLDNPADSQTAAHGAVTVGNPSAARAAESGVAQTSAAAAPARPEPLPLVDGIGVAAAVPQVASLAAAPAAAAGKPATPVEARVAVPLDNPAFGGALGAQISVLVRDGVQTANLQLNPADMGPIAVQIALDGSAARVDFQADLASTRQVIEASLPALAGALQDAGFTLAGGGVFQQNPGRQGQGDAPAPGQPRQGNGNGTGQPQAEQGGAGSGIRSTGRGLVDLVA